VAAATVRDALQRYADRGVFRGFSETRGRGGTQEFRFTWLTRAPMVLSHDNAAGTLTFKRLLPEVARASPLLADVEALIKGRSGRSVAAHRRIDARRLGVQCVHRRGTVTLVLHVKGRHQAYAVQRGVNLVHEIFTLLQASYPDYLWESFGLPAE
jgi:hypothetical protein